MSTPQSAPEPRKRLPGTSVRDRYLRKTYGISEAFYLALLEYQGGVCFICHRKPGRVLLAVDHNHLTGEVRGLVCGRSARDHATGRDYPACNRIIGMAHDSPAFFRRGADYLENPPARRLKERLEAEHIQEMRETVALNDAQVWDWFDE